MVTKPSLLIVLGALLTSVATHAQAATDVPTVATIEPGLEHVVSWPWKVEPSTGVAWGHSSESSASIAETPLNPETPPAPKAPSAPEKAVDHSVVRGESLTVIARHYAVTIDQIKSFNDLNSDVIRVDQVLRIPGIDDIKAMTKPTPETAAVKPASKPVQAAPILISTKPRRALPPAAWRASALVQTQVFLDRQGFTVGPIDGTSGSIYAAAFDSFEKARPGEIFTSDGRPSAAMLAMGGPYTEYELRAEDLNWISPTTDLLPKSRNRETPDLTLEELTQETMLKYRSAWEFVAERFHASETFLRSINPHIKAAETPGATFLVPNVIPFEIENAFAEPLQPRPDVAAPIEATIINLKRLVVRRSGAVIASMPISVARPGLRGRGTWKILEATARPRMTSTGPTAAPSSTPVTLADGPNNPVGIAWIDLAKASSPTPLPYGLHGTSIPGHMMKLESIGGFRLTNWDIARVLRLLPVGTDLNWE